MRRFFRYTLYIIVCLIFTLNLSACTALTSVYKNYRDIEDIRLIQVVHFDEIGDNYIVSVASAGDIGDEEAIILSATAPSISMAFEDISAKSTAATLYYAHVSSILLSANSANNIDTYLDYIKSNLDFRLDTNMILVEDYSDNSDIVQTLSSLETYIKKSGYYIIYSAQDILCMIEKYNVALILALDGDFMPLGYAILREGEIVGYIENETAYCVSILSGDFSEGSIYVEDCRCTVSFSDISTKFEDNRLNVKISVNILEGVLDVEELELMVKTWFADFFEVMEIDVTDIAVEISHSD